MLNILNIWLEPNIQKKILETHGSRGFKPHENYLTKLQKTAQKNSGKKSSDVLKKTLKEVRVLAEIY